MRLSTSTNIYFNRPDGSKAAIESSMTRCARAGYRVMDLNFHDCTTFDLPFTGEGHQAWIEGIGELAERLGLVFSQAHGPFYNFCDESYPGREYMDGLIRRAIDHAAILRIPWMVLHAGTDFAAARLVQSSKRKNLDYLSPLVDYAASRSVGIALENLWELNIKPKRRYTANAEELCDLIDAFRSDNVGACYDVGHATIMEQDQRAQLLCIGRRLRATHVSDCINIDSDHMLPFSGRTPWAEVMAALEEIGYQGDFTYEIHRYTAALPDALVDEALRHSVAVGEYLLGCNGVL